MNLLDGKEHRQFALHLEQGIEDSREDGRIVHVRRAVQREHGEAEVRQGRNRHLAEPSVSVPKKPLRGVEVVFQANSPARPRRRRPVFQADLVK